MSFLFRVATVEAGSVWGARGTTANAFLFGFILLKQTRASYILSPFIFQFHQNMTLWLQRPTQGFPAAVWLGFWAPLSAVCCSLFLLSFSLGRSLKSDTNAWPTGLPTATNLLGSYRDCIALEQPSCILKCTQTFRGFERCACRLLKQTVLSIAHAKADTAPRGTQQWKSACRGRTRVLAGT